AEEPDKPNPATLKNGHTVPISGPGVCNVGSQEEEATKTPSLRKGVPAEEPKKRQGSSSSHSGPELEASQEPHVPKQPLLPPKRPPSTSQEANETQAKDPTPPSAAKPAPTSTAPSGAKTVTAAPSPAPRTLPPVLPSANTTAPTSTTSIAPAKQPPVPPPKPLNRNSNSVIGE
ncbi:PHAR4 regulator, partial [Turnix velox]|nr:PHAR4 regulator [Turnix velox]